MKEKTSMFAIILIALSAIFASAGQIFFKFAANNTVDVVTFLANQYLYLGGLAYGIGLLFMLKALRRGELTVIYPVMATSFIWVSVLSPIFFETDFMTLQKWAGVFIIIVGVTLIGRGRTK